MTKQVKQGFTNVINGTSRLIIQEIKEQNPTSCRLHELYEFIYLLCTAAKSLIDSKGNLQFPVLIKEIDKSEEPYFWYMLNEVNDGFEITENYLKQTEPDLVKILTESKNIFHLMLDKNIRAAEIIDIKGSDRGSIQCELFKDMARLAIDLEKASSPILVAAKDYEGKPISAENKNDHSHKRQAPQTNRSSEQQPKKNREPDALALLQSHPSWTNKQIADALGINKKTLSRYKTFRQAKKLLQSKDDLPGGSKSKEGNIEAWER